jgi:hypothetical protein
MSTEDALFWLLVAALAALVWICMDLLEKDSRSKRAMAALAATAREEDIERALLILDGEA